MKKAITALNVLIVLWISYVFLGSLPYKFSNAPDTQHIFGTIGEWMKGFLGNTVGQSFSDYGAYAVGTGELIISIMLLGAIIMLGLNTMGIVKNREKCIAKKLQWGGLGASALMAGAVFFHLFTPLGIEVLHNGQSDGGSLFRAAVSILVLGLVLFFMNKKK